MVGGYDNYASWMQGTVCHHLAEADLVVFTGGADISPNLYHDQAHPATCCNSSRDREEIEQFDYAQLLGKPIVGICRGAQLMCALAGGKLIQHQENNHPHKMFTNEPGNPLRKNIEITVGGDHHQAQYPWGLPLEDWDLYGYSRGASRFHYSGGGYEMISDHDASAIVEVEIAYYRKINALAIQSHPEWVANPDNSAEVNYCRTLLRRLLQGNL